MTHLNNKMININLNCGESVIFMKIAKNVQHLRNNINSAVFFKFS